MEISYTIPTWPDEDLFLTVDRHLGNPKRPQSWNRYSYVANNPLAYIDPEGALRLRAIGGSGGTFEVAFTTGFGSAVADELRRDLPDQGEVVGQAGTSGNAAGIEVAQEHLHFALKDAEGNLLDPEVWLNDPDAPPPAVPEPEPDEDEERERQ
jgi:hypothetical protein